jgi:hypothetical protein
LSARRAVAVAALVLLTLGGCTGERTDPYGNAKVDAIKSNPLMDLHIPGITPTGPTLASGGGTIGGPGDNPPVGFRTWTVADPSPEIFAAVLTEARAKGYQLDSLNCGVKDPSGIYYIATGGQDSYRFPFSVNISLKGNELTVYMTTSNEASPSDKINLTPFQTDGKCDAVIMKAAGAKS